MSDGPIIYVDMKQINKDHELWKKWIHECFDRHTCKPNAYWKPFNLWKAEHKEDE